MKKQDTFYWVLGIILLIIGIAVIILVVGVQSQTQETPATSLSVNNVTPSVDAIKVCLGSGDPSGCSGLSSVTLTPGTTREHSVSGSISDSNGFSDITVLTATFHRVDVLVGCSVDNNNCYRESLAGAGCTLTADTSTAGFFDCSINLAYFAQATDVGSLVSEGAFPSDIWRAHVVIEDTAAATDNSATTLELNSLRAIETDEGDGCATIEYGEIANGAATADSSVAGTACVIENAGNVDMDITESGSFMSCTFGGIDPTQQRVNVSSGTYADMSSGGTNLSSSAQTINMALSKAISAVNANDQLFHAISVPSTGASGSCTGTNTITAIAEV